MVRPPPRTTLTYPLCPYPTRVRSPGDEHDTSANLLKGTTFRLVSSTKAFAIGYGFSGDPVAAGGFMVASAIGETAVYVANEYGWAFYDRSDRKSTRLKSSH